MQKIQKIIAGLLIFVSLGFTGLVPAKAVVADDKVSYTQQVKNTHVFYVSSKAKTSYYCDTDSTWKNLSKKNLLKYSSEKKLRKDFPKLKLHRACRK